jgi:hypothetical protein
MQSGIWRTLAVCLIGCVPSVGAQVAIHVTDLGGKALQDALVIVQDLQHQDRELFRALSDAQGNIPPHALGPGLYRAIGTYPYSHWQTDVHEFLVRGDAVKVQLRLPETDSLDITAVSIGTLTVHVLDASGHPAAGARVLVRDAEANPDSEHWGTTNAQGTTTLELSLTPAVLVVVYRDQLYTFPTGGLDTERTLRLK